MKPSAPATVDPVVAQARLRAGMSVIPDALGIPADRVVLKVRRRQKGLAQYERLATTGRFREVREGGLRFLVNLTDYLDTGLFLDHRPTRALIRGLAPGGRFLNLFAYTGAFSVAAAAGGAEIAPVLKADGYGHGAAIIGRTALNNGALMVGVACLAEAIHLRRAGLDAPVLVRIEKGLLVSAEGPAGVRLLEILDASPDGRNVGELTSVGYSRRHGRAAYTGNSRCVSIR